MDKRDIVVVPDLPANELVRIVREERRVSYTVIDPAWDFYRNHDGSPISGRGKSFEFKLWEPKQGASLKEVREHFAEIGFSGHVGAFLQWCHQFASEGFYMTIPDDQACWRDERDAQLLWVPCIDFHEPNRALRRRIVSGESTFGGWGVLGFRELTV